MIFNHKNCKMDRCNAFSNVMALNLRSLKMISMFCSSVLYVKNRAKKSTLMYGSQFLPQTGDKTYGYFFYESDTFEKKLGMWVV